MDSIKIIKSKICFPLCPAHQILCITGINFQERSFVVIYVVKSSFFLYLYTSYVESGIRLQEIHTSGSIFFIHYIKYFGTTISGLNPISVKICDNGCHGNGRHIEKMPIILKFKGFFFFFDQPTQKLTYRSNFFFYYLL